MTTVSDRAHARDLAYYDAERKRRDAAYPQAIRVLELIAPVYLSAYKARGRRDPRCMDLLQVSDALLDEMGEGRDIPEGVADDMLAILEDRL